MIPFFQHIKKTRRGFTLLELLVVIGIIAILIGMAAVSYSSAQKKARDAQRKGNLHAIQAAMEEYYSLCNYVYPTIPAGGLTTIATTATQCNNNASTIMTVPTDPLGSNYECPTGATCDGTQYTVCSPVVNGTSRLETADCTSSTPSGGCCASNQQ